MGVSLCVTNNKNNLTLLRNEHIYSLKVYGNDWSRTIVWDKNKHPQLTEFVDRMFPDKKCPQQIMRKVVKTRDPKTGRFVKK